LNLLSYKNTNRRLTGVLCIAFLISSIVLSIGFFLGYKIAHNKQHIFRILVSNSISRFFILKNTSKSTVAKLRNDLKEVECPASHVAIATFGQSNSANRVLRSKGLIAINDGKTFMWDWTSGKCYPYSEPVVGTDGLGKGNILTDTITKLREMYTGNLIIIAFAKGGSSVFDWSHARLSVRLDAVLNRLKEHAIYPNVFLWHQGETDATPEQYTSWKKNAYGNKTGSPYHYYESALSLITQKIGSSFPKSIIGVALASICKNKGSSLIVGAQKYVADKNTNVKVTINTDMLGKKYRHDGCHFNELGAAKIGKVYALFTIQHIETVKH
jgi:hypothetical protein